MKAKQLLLAFVLSLFVLSLGAELFINEVLASNQVTNANSFGEFGDWVELYNSGDTPVNLQGYYLSDSADDLQKWQFPSINIAAGAYLIVWATDRNTLTGTGEVHTNFKISNLETITLSSATGLIIDQIVLPALNPDQSYGLQTDGNLPWLYFNSPSPGLSNNGSIGYLGFLTEATPSHSGGFYPENIFLSFSDIPEGAQLLYTLDGSIPSYGASQTLVYNPGDVIELSDRSQEANNLSAIRTTVVNDASWIETWYPPPRQCEKGKCDSHQNNQTRLPR